VYATAHVHDVDCRDIIEDGGTFVDTDAGFEVAPGDASDIEIANAHAWGSSCLVFNDGAIAATALWIAEIPSSKGMSHCFFEAESCNAILIKIGMKFANFNHLQRNGASVAAKEDYDVLLRKRDADISLPDVALVVRAATHVRQSSRLTRAAVHPGTWGGVKFLRSHYERQFRGRHARLQ
jgi:hypothetical protein